MAYQQSQAFEQPEPAMKRVKHNEITKEDTRTSRHNSLSGMGGRTTCLAFYLACAPVLVMGASIDRQRQLDEDQQRRPRRAPALLIAEHE